jgi:putative intracellular protease/amidase
MTGGRRRSARPPDQVGKACSLVRAMARVWIPVPDRDFDVTEVAVPWKLLHEAGHEIVFATERGGRPAADPLLLAGVLFGQLGADPEPKRFYREMEGDPSFAKPETWESIDPGAFDGLILPGGHAKGMRQYLESETLRARIASFWALERPVGAICHGTIALVRTKRDDGKSVLHGLRTTCLPKRMERAAWLLTAWKLGDYYRTYPEWVEDEVRRHLASPRDLDPGPLTLVARGTRDDDRAAFVVEDGRYVSARWPGDAYLFAKRFMARLAGSAQRGPRGVAA